MNPDPTAQPVLTFGGIALAVSALLTALVAFGLPITDDQVQAVLGVFTAAGPIVLALWAIRARVTPSSKVIAQVGTFDGEPAVVAGAAALEPTGAPVELDDRGSILPGNYVPQVTVSGAVLNR